MGWGGESAAATSALEQAEADLRGAVAADPSLARAWAELGKLQHHTGQFDKAKLSARRALNADAFLENAREIISILTLVALEERDFDEALRWTAEGLRRYPRNLAFVNLALLIYASDGAPKAAPAEGWKLVDQLEEGTPEESWPSWHMMMAAVLARAGLEDSARAVISWTRDSGLEDPWAAYYEANARLLLGERDATLRLLEEFLRLYRGQKAFIANDAWFIPLHDDSTFQSLVEEAE